MEQPSLLSSQRIALRAFESDDLPALHAYLNHPGLEGRRYLPWGFSDNLPLSRKQAEGILEKWGASEKAFHLALISRESHALLGHVDCEWGWDPHCPYIGLVVAPPYQSLGYGSEVLRLLLDYLFETTPAHNVHSWIASWNTSARVFARANGFSESGQARREGLFRGVPFDSVLVDILRPEWQRSRSQVSHAA